MSVFDIVDSDCRGVEPLAKAAAAEVEPLGLNGMARHRATMKKLTPLLIQHASTCERCIAYVASESEESYEPDNEAADEADGESVVPERPAGRVQVAAFGGLVIAQLILHYLGWLGIIGGVVATVAGNWGRGKELLIGGAAMIVLKYVIGFAFVASQRRR